MTEESNEIWLVLTRIFEVPGRNDDDVGVVSPAPEVEEGDGAQCGTLVVNALNGGRLLPGRVGDRFVVVDGRRRLVPGRIGDGVGYRVVYRRGSGRFRRREECLQLEDT